MTPGYVLRLITEEKLRATVAKGGRRNVNRADVEAYRVQQQARSRNALEELANVSQEAGLYKKC